MSDSTNSIEYKSSFFAICQEIKRLSLNLSEESFSVKEATNLRLFFIKSLTNIQFLDNVLNALNTYSNEDYTGRYLFLKRLLPSDFYFTQLLTEQELFQVVLPIPMIHQIEIKTTTELLIRKVPKIPVLIWKDFLSNAFYTSTAIDTINHIFSRPDEIDEALSSKDSAVDLFLNIMKAINNKRLILLSKPESWGKSYIFQKIKGKPDIIRCSANTTQLLINSRASQLLSVVKVKSEQLMCNLIGDETELFNAYNTALTMEDDETITYTKHQKIIKIVRQLFGYMIINNLKYGLLTTYIRTWFFYRQNENPDNIYISPTVYINQSHTNSNASFLECMYYFESISTIDPIITYSFLSNTDEDNSSDNEDKDDNRNNDDKDEDDGNKNDKNKKTLNVFTWKKDKKKEKEFLNSMKNYKCNQFSFGDVLGSGRFGDVFTVKLYKKVGALKMANLYKSEYLLQKILNELKIYLEPLKEIQGIYIPKLLNFGVFHEVFVFILTSLAGESFANVIDNITENEKQLAINGLLAIHKRGVKHGDIRLENIMLKKDELTGCSCVWWIDFAQSKMIDNAKNLDKELVKLKHLLGIKENRKN